MCHCAMRELTDRKRGSTNLSLRSRSMIIIMIIILYGRNELEIGEMRLDAR